MLKRIFNWFAEGQAPPPEVLDEERGVDWDAWREAYDGVEWREAYGGVEWDDAAMTAIAKMRKPWYFPEILYDPRYNTIPGNVYYHDD